jgi:hypothetical protein
VAGQARIVYVRAARKTLACGPDQTLDDFMGQSPSKPMVPNDAEMELDPMKFIKIIPPIILIVSLSVTKFAQGK